jgi:DNA repair protein RadB
MFLRRAPAPPHQPRLPTACASLDDLLGGGLEAGVLTEVHGEAGTGKTNLCLQLAREAARAGGRVVLVDTEGFSPERLAQLCGDALPEVQRRLLVEEPRTLGDQARALRRAARIAAGARDVRLVIVDSATLLYRLELGDGDAQGERRALLKQLHALAQAARHGGAALVVTNQVFSVPGEDGVQGLGGHGLRHLAGCALRLERSEGLGGARAAVLLKHRSRPEGLRAGFALGPRGLESLAATPDAASVASASQFGPHAKMLI